MLKALIITKVHNDLLSTLNQLGYESKVESGVTKTYVISIIHQYEGVITSNALSIDKDIIEAGTNLKWIGRMGSGMEIIDTEFAIRKNIHCFGSPDGNANAVAEQALGMLLSLKHNIVKSHIELQNGIWKREENRGFELENSTAGIIGLGNNGRAFAQKLSAMNVKVLAYDTNSDIQTEKNVTLCNSLDEIYQNVDMLSFHVPLKDDTQYYFDHDFLNKMQRNFILLNLSRGKVVNLEALYNGMVAGKIRGAALDVWEDEPVTKTQNSHLEHIFRQLINMPNFIGTSHIAGYTYEAVYKMSMSLAEKIRSLHL